MAASDTRAAALLADAVIDMTVDGASAPTDLALLGFGPTRARAPKTAEWWALGWDTDAIGPERWYEIHDRAIWDSGMTKPLDKPRIYAAWLAELPGRVVLKNVEDDVPGSEAYPFQAVGAIPGVSVRGDGVPWLCSTMAYMLCHAWLEGYGRPQEHGGRGGKVGLYGFDFMPKWQWQEIAFERPNLAYLIGLFRAKSMTIELPVSCDADLWRLDLLCDFIGAAVFPAMPLWQEMYLRGWAVGSGMPMKDALRADMTAVPWPCGYYGDDRLEDVGAEPVKWAARLRRELGWWT